MRFLMMIIVFLAAAEAADTLYFDGIYRKAAWEELNYQGQQFRQQINTFVRKDIAP